MKYLIIYILIQLKRIIITNREEIAKKMRNDLIHNPQNNFYYSNLFKKNYKDLITPFDKDPLNKMHTYGDRSDVIKDDINIQPVMDIMSVSEGTPVSAFLNGSATLNSFNTNGFSVCDILRYGGGKIEICYS